MATVKKVKAPKIFKILSTRRGRTSETVGTIAELTQYFSYTLECGKSYEWEKGNKKINVAPKGIKSLVKNIDNAKNNSAANGWSDTSYSEGTITEEDKIKYMADLESQAA